MIILIALYLIAIVAANVSVAVFGASMVIVNAFVFIGLDLTTRDTLHEHWQGCNLIRNMALLIAAGSILSYAVNADAGKIALASFIAFACAAVSDAIVYQLLGDRARLVKMNGSNVVSALVDSIVFPAIAFGFPMLWGIVAGQFIAKVAGGFVWSLILNRIDIRVKVA